MNDATLSASQWIGKPLRRLEDARLLTGQGRYTDDVPLAGAAEVAFLRSPHAHARIARLDIAAARGARRWATCWSAWCSGRRSS